MNLTSNFQKQSYYVQEAKEFLNTSVLTESLNALTARVTGAMAKANYTARPRFGHSSHHLSNAFFDAG